MQTFYNKTIIFRIAAKFLTSEQSDNANVSLYPLGDELYAFSESKMLYKINTEDLSTAERININEYIAVLHNTAHPHVLKDGR